MTNQGPKPPSVEGASYPYFLLHLDKISEWLRAGFTKKTVWEACRAHPGGFAGSYRTFLRYCKKHAPQSPRGEVGRSVRRPEAPAPQEAPRGVSFEAPSVGGSRTNRYPAPLARPPMLRLTEEEWKT
ncbi:MAG: TraK family protein [Polyangiales bacterium]